VILFLPVGESLHMRLPDKYPVQVMPIW